MQKLLDICVRVTAFVFLACFPVAAMAQVAGTGPICDTAEQLEKVVSYATESRNFEASLQRVNAEQKQESACAVAAAWVVRMPNTFSGCVNRGSILGADWCGLRLPAHLTAQQNRPAH
jgi:hypothetical protein